MGRKKRKNLPSCEDPQQQGPGNKRNNKKKKSWKGGQRQRYWIEYCHESTECDPTTAALTVLISIVELTDNHLSQPLTNASDETSKNGKSHGKFMKEAAASPSMDEAATEEAAVSPNVDEESIREAAAAAAANVNGKDDAESTNKKLDDSPREDCKPAAKTNEDGSVDSLPPSRLGKNATTICIRKHVSAKKPQKFKNNGRDFCHLPDGDCGDGVKNPYPKNIVADKFWAQRKRLFSLFDKGIKLDQESWYSVTPEAIANHQAECMSERLAVEKSDLVLLDAFCGAGGNAIAFARHPAISLVVCVDTDPSKLQMAANNAKIYGIPEKKLLFVHGDACDVIQQYKDGKRLPDSSAVAKSPEEIHGYRFGGLDHLPKLLCGIFLSPPWGGENYLQIKDYNLRSITLDNDVNGEKLLEYSARAVPSTCGCVAVFLPKSTNGVSVGKSAVKIGIAGTMEFEQNVLNKKLKAITIYTGPPVLENSASVLGGII